MPVVPAHGSKLLSMTAVLSLSILLLSSNTLAANKINNTSPDFGIPPGMKAPNMKNFDPEREKYLILMVQRGPDSVELQPVLVRLHKDYVQSLKDSYESSLKSWTEGGQSWAQNPANKGKTYDIPKPSPAVIVNQLGPFAHQQAQASFNAMKEQMTKKQQAETKKELAKWDEEAKAKEKAEEKRKEQIDNLLGDKAGQKRDKVKDDLDDVGDE